MSDYRRDDELFSGQLERDMSHADNLRFLSDRYAVPLDRVLKLIRHSIGKIEEVVGEDGEIISSAELADAPPGLTDVQWADWAVDLIRKPK